MISFRSACAASVLTLAVLPLAAVGDPAERVTTAADGAAFNVTIYNGTISLVHDRREIELASGENRLAWRDVSAQMDPSTAALDDLTSPGATRVDEQNFDFDLIDPATILDKYVGRDVIVVHDTPAFTPAREMARLLSDNDGVVLQYRDRIETGLTNAHLAFPALPPGLRDRPTLTLTLASAHAAREKLDLAYLTNGLSWHADYVGVVSPDETSMRLSGLVTLSNTSGASYPNARIQLVAGNVNVPPPPPTLLRTIGRVRAAGTENGTPGGVTQENYFEYHLYTLGRPTTIADKQTKQVALLHAEGIPIHETLELRGSAAYYSNQDADLGQHLKVGVYETFENRGGELGIPLPGGNVRLYKTDRGGTSQFLGGDAIDHTPRNAEVRLHLGDSFDVTANKKQTDFRGLGNCTYESSYDVRLANAKAVPANVLVVEPIPGTWSIVSENLPHVKSSSATATWPVRVPADSSVTLSYRAHVDLCF